jgi:ribonucleoside-diphosphate reductase alpha chain
MRGADASAGTIKSGGKTRRAAKMVILDVDHPDVEDFIWCKAIEERKARVLRDAGFDMDLDGAGQPLDPVPERQQLGAGDRRVHGGRHRRARLGADGAHRRLGHPTVPARDLFRQIAHSAWECADPGLQYDTTINRWHTAPMTGRINGSNPCSRVRAPRQLGLQPGVHEPAHVPRRERRVRRRGLQGRGGGHVHRPGDHRRQRRLPDREDRRERRGAFRELGIGYANLGALLMAQGLPYDSDAGRAWAAAITALLTGHAYATSARTAARMGPFAGFHENAEPMLNVLRMHQAEAAHRRGGGPARAALGRPRRPGTRRSSWPSSTACATRRLRCWPRRAPSAC